MIVRLEKSEQIDAYISVTGVVLLDFYADWCEPCKWLDVILEHVDNRLSSRIPIVKIDIEKNIFLSEKFNIKSVPVLIIFENGEEKWRVNGFLNEDDLVLKIGQFSRET